MRKAKEREEREKNTSGRKRIGGMTTAHIVTKRGPMVHGIQFYISRVLKDKKGRETKSKKKRRRRKKEKMPIKELRYFRDTIYSRYIYQAPFPARPRGSAVRWELDGNSKLQIRKVYREKKIPRGEDVCVAIEWREGKSGRLMICTYNQISPFPFLLSVLILCNNCISRFFYDKYGIERLFELIYVPVQPPKI